MKKVRLKTGNLTRKEGVFGSLFFRTRTVFSCLAAFSYLNGFPRLAAFFRTRTFFRILRLFLFAATIFPRDCPRNDCFFKVFPRFLNVSSLKGLPLKILRKKGVLLIFSVCEVFPKNKRRRFGNSSFRNRTIGNMFDQKLLTWSFDEKTFRSNFLTAKKERHVCLSFLKIRIKPIR